MTYRIVHHEALTSTNSEALIAASEDAPEGTVMACREQTAGRGQRNSEWVSNAGDNVTASLILRPPIKANSIFMLSKAFSLAVAETLNEYGIDASIKWPNDIYVETRKIAGILTEHCFRADELNYSVIGLGLNVRQTDFPPMDTVPTSIAAETGAFREPDEVLSSVLECFSPLYGQLCIPAHYRSIWRLPHHNALYNQICSASLRSVNERYMNKLFRRNGFFLYKRPNGETFEAEITNVADSGELFLRQTNGKTESFLFKEIEFVI
jgi:BirA family biotin operon repressor/biotin-[acetyl-CoA-carboxylase] ligase